MLQQELASSLQPASDPVFEERIERLFPRIRRQFHQLYAYRDDVDSHLSSLEQVLRDKWRQRPQTVKQIDQQRIGDPAWFLSQKWVGMMLYVDLFNKDLKGFLSQLDYLQELGVNYVHLMPILRAPKDHNDGGYAVSDYRSIDERFGSLRDLEEVAGALRDRGMLLMLDIVINHTSDEHEWAQKAKSGDATYQDYYYFFADRTVPDQFEHSLPQVFPETAPGNFTYVKDVDQWVMTVFNDYQWDLNYTNPQVFVEMLDVLLMLSNWGADVLRLDALAFMWKRIGTDSQNLQEAHLLVQAFKTCIQIAAPGSIFLAEAIVAPQEIIRYFGAEEEGRSNECDLAYNATLMTLLWESVTTKSNKLLKVSLENVPSKPEMTTWITYLRCHDDIGLGYEDLHAGWAGYDPWSHRQFIQDYLTGRIDWSKSRGLPFMEDRATGSFRISGSLASLAGLERAIESGDPWRIQQAVDHIIMLHAVILSYGGIPMLYMGDELGLLNDYSYQDHQAKRGDNRWVHRPVMDWDTASRRTKNNTTEYRIFQAIRDLVAARKTVVEFVDHNNTYLFDCGNERVLAFGRYLEHSKVLAVFNLNDHEEWLSVDHLRREGLHPENGLIDRSNGFAVDQPYEQLKLAPFEFHWLSDHDPMIS
ncbi:MAG: amylosucrase [Bacteroidota bacterium]